MDTWAGAMCGGATGAPEIDDPTDWPAEFQHLAALDQTLRCAMCGDLYKTAMMTKCGHNFCSLCVRGRITGADTSCPVCREPLLESGLRPNRLIDDIIASFAASRAQLLALARLQQNGGAATSRSTPPPQPSTPAPGELAAPTPTTSWTPNEPLEPASSLTNGSDRVLRKKRSRLPSELVASMSADAADSAAIAGDSDSDFEIVNERPPSACPICGAWMSPTALAKHAPQCADAQETRDRKRHRTSSHDAAIGDDGDACSVPGRGGGGSSAGGSASGSVGSRSSPNHHRHPGGSGGGSVPTTRLPRTNYHLLKTAKIASMLRDAGLRADGPRAKLVDRHREWVRLHNANLDAAPARRLGLRALRRQLADAERARENATRATTTGLIPVAALGAASSSSIGSSAGAAVRESFVAPDHLVRYKEQFYELIEAARATHLAAAQAAKAMAQKVPKVGEAARDGDSQDLPIPAAHFGDTDLDRQNADTSMEQEDADKHALDALPPGDLWAAPPATDS